jgi:16S rRNA (cytosine967-C5)-methyltransferase
MHEAKRFVKPSGQLVYITCSLLDAENGAQIGDFLAKNPDFSLIDPTTNADARGLTAIAEHRDPRGLGLLLTPHRTDTDGFFVAVLTRTA